MLTPRTDHEMLALCLGKTEHRLAARALAINMSFSVSELAFPELEEAAEFLVFPASLSDIS